jgi:hypothetical protein
MAKSIGDILGDKLKGMKVEKTPDPPKPRKGKPNEIAVRDDYYEKPTMWLTDKDFSGVKDITGGQDVYLAVKARVASYNSNERVDDKGEKNTRTEVRLELLEIANITDLKDVKKK